MSKTNNMRNLLLALSLFAAIAAAGQTEIRNQCQGVTAKQEQCKRYTTETDSTWYCYQHQPNAPRCGQPTKSGDPCRIRVKVSGEACHLHTQTD